jgi:3',5'-cyclic AMP phosphodiesterase CpdA
MTGDRGTSGSQSSFRYVRLRRNLAIIGLNSGVPQSLRKAGGSLGPKQLEALPGLLHDLKAKGYYRAVMIHHPPLPGLAPPRKALTDAARLRDILAGEGAELVLHGHNHRQMLNVLPGRDGNIPVIGVPSASTNDTGPAEPAAWNLYEISRNQGSWLTEVSIRAWDPVSRRMVPKNQFTLPS